MTQRSRVIEAPAQAIFDLLADPRGHAVIDGSGPVRDVQEGTPDRLGPGVRFGMQMRWALPYKILNEVVEFDEPRVIAWRHFGGHVWRWILDPVDDQHTNVTEQFDARPSKGPVVLRLMGSQRRSGGWIDASLDRLADWAAQRS